VSAQKPHVKTSKTIAQVERMVACGLDYSQIAYVLECSPVQVKADYAQELEHGTSAVVAKVGAALLRQALRGDTNAAQFFLRSRAKWVTPTKIEQDVSVTVDDKRKLMDDIVTLVAAGSSKKGLERAKQLADAQAPPGSKPS
jgi:hypothetical protein